MAPIRAGFGLDGAAADRIATPFGAPGRIEHELPAAVAAAFADMPARLDDAFREATVDAVVRRSRGR